MRDLRISTFKSVGEIGPAAPEPATTSKAAPADANGSEAGPFRRVPAAGTWTRFTAFVRRTFSPAPATDQLMARRDFGDRLRVALESRSLPALRDLIDRMPAQDAHAKEWIDQIVSGAATFEAGDRAELTIALARKAYWLPSALARMSIFHAALTIGAGERDLYQAGFWLWCAEDLLGSLSTFHAAQAEVALRQHWTAWNDELPDSTLPERAAEVGQSAPEEMADKVGLLIRAASARSPAIQLDLLRSLAAQADRLSPRALRQVAAAAGRLASPEEFLNGLLDRLEELHRGPQATAIWLAVSGALPSGSTGPLRARLDSLRNLLPEGTLDRPTDVCVIKIWPARFSLTSHFGHVGLNVKSGQNNSYMTLGIPRHLMRYSEDKRNTLAARTKQNLKSGKFQPRAGQKKTRHNGIAFDWGESAQKIHVPLCGSKLPAKRALFGLSGAHIMLAWQARLAEVDDGRRRFRLVSTEDNCSGTILRMLKAGGASLFVNPPRAMLFIAPNDVNDYAIELRSELAALNGKADALLTEYDKRCALFSLTRPVTLAAALQSYQDRGLEPLVELDAASEDRLALLSQARKLTLAVNETADSESLALLRAIYDRLRELGPGTPSETAHRPPDSVSVATPSATRRMPPTLLTRIARWFPRGEPRSPPQWMLSAARQIGSLPVNEQLRAFDHLLEKSSQLDLKMQGSVLSLLADQVKSLAPASQDLAARKLLDASQTMQPATRKELAGRVGIVQGPSERRAGEGPSRTESAGSKTL